VHAPIGRVELRVNVLVLHQRAPTQEERAEKATLKEFLQHGASGATLLLTHTVGIPINNAQVSVQPQRRRPR